MRVRHEALPSPEVVAAIRGWRAGDLAPVDMIFMYSIDDPIAVSLIIPSQPGVDEEVVWSFGRSLLVGGLYSCTGIGDVCVEPAESSDFITVGLYDEEEDDKEAYLIPRDPMVDFLNETSLRVPFGRESSYVLPALNDFVDSFYVPHKLPSKK